MGITKWSRGSLTVEGIEPPSMVKISSHLSVIGKRSAGHNRFRRKDGKMQYLVAYHPETKVSIWVVREVIREEGLPSLLPREDWVGDITEYIVYKDGERLL